MNSIIVVFHNFLFWLTVYSVGYIDMKLKRKHKAQLDTQLISNILK